MASQAGTMLNIKSSISDPLQEYGTKLFLVECGACRQKLFKDESVFLHEHEDIVKQQTINDPSKPRTRMLPNGFIKCSHCRARSCIGCGMVPAPPSKKEDATTPLPPCCDEGRIFCIFTWLCVLEIAQNYKQDPPKSPSRKKLTKENKSNRGMTFRETNGTGYVGDQHDHYHDHEDLLEAHPELVSSSLLANLAKKSRRHKNFVPAHIVTPEQIMIPLFFEALNELLAAYQGTTSISVLRVMLEKSRAMETIASLLRTDSLEVIASKSRLYDDMLSVFERLFLVHPTFRTLITQPRKLYPNTLYAMTIKPQSIDPARLPEEVTPLLPLFAKLHRATRRFHQQALAMSHEFDDETGKKMINFCDRVNVLHQMQEIEVGKGKSPRTDTPVNDRALSQAEENKQWHLEHCIEPVEDKDYAKFADSFSTPRDPNLMQPKKGRMKRLMTEITSLQSSLPEGVYIRYGVSRPDLMKVMIVGPSDTPYEAGLFEFDMAFPFNYPDAPPKMLFRTTGGGRAHFNPNLYQDGKVCLSLLGTWSGPSWQPNKSTILQVLVSIQAMILCGEPWYNEPGRETRANELRSQQYNFQIQGLTTRYAITQQLKDYVESLTHPAAHNHRYFPDVVERHFRTNGPNILKTLRGWEKKQAEFKQKLPQLAKEFPPQMPMFTSMPNTNLQKLPSTMPSATMIPADPWAGDPYLHPGMFMSPTHAGLSSTNLTYPMPQTLPGAIAHGQKPVQSLPGTATNVSNENTLYTKANLLPSGAVWEPELYESYVMLPWVASLAFSVKKLVFSLLKFTALYKSCLVQFPTGPTNPVFDPSLPQGVRDCVSDILKLLPAYPLFKKSLAEQTGIGEYPVCEQMLEQMMATEETYGLQMADLDKVPFDPNKSTAPIHQSPSMYTPYYAFGHPMPNSFVQMPASQAPGPTSPSHMQGIHMNPKALGAPVWLQQQNQTQNDAVSKQMQSFQMAAALTKAQMQLDLAHNGPPQPVKMSISNPPQSWSEIPKSGNPVVHAQPGNVPSAKKKKDVTPNKQDSPGTSKKKVKKVAAAGMEQHSSGSYTSPPSWANIAAQKVKAATSKIINAASSSEAKPEAKAASTLTDFSQHAENLKGVPFKELTIPSAYLENKNPGQLHEFVINTFLEYQAQKQVRAPSFYRLNRKRLISLSNQISEEVVFLLKQ